METGDRLYVGSKLKYLLEIEGDGFSMEYDDFEILLKGGAGSVRITKDEMAVDDDGKYYVPFDTKALGAGLVKAVVTARVPDPDFKGGIRDEVYVIDRFANIMNV